MKKNAFFTFFFAFIPGAGQMYLGLLKRGVSIMATFCAVCMVVWLLPIVGWFLPVIWFVSFFDTFNVANKLTAGEPITDEIIFGLDDTISTFFANGKSRFNGKGQRYFAIGIIVLGCYILFDNIVMQYLYNLNYMLMESMPMLGNLVQNIISDIPVLIISIFIILLGVKLLKGTKPKPVDTEELVAYKGSDEYSENENSENEDNKNDETDK
ncbi:MAG: hypothetical protein RR052_00450 [Oscillospiraceae bacterium]